MYMEIHMGLMDSHKILPESSLTYRTLITTITCINTLADVNLSKTTLMSLITINFLTTLSCIELSYFLTALISLTTLSCTTTHTCITTVTVTFIPMQSDLNHHPYNIMYYHSCHYYLCRDSTVIKYEKHFPKM